MKKRSLSVLAIAALLLACKPSAQATPAQDKPLEQESAEQNRMVGDDSKGYEECKEQAQGGIETAECISTEKDRQDARLNASYSKLLKLLSGDSKERLVQAQRAWITLKDKDLTFEASVFENTQAENLTSYEREMLYLKERADRIDGWIELVSAK